MYSRAYQWLGIRKSLTTNRCNSGAGTILLLVDDDDAEADLASNVQGLNANATCNGLNTCTWNVSCILRGIIEQGSILRMDTSDYKTVWDYKLALTQTLCTYRL